MTMSNPDIMDLTGRAGVLFLPQFRVHDTEAEARGDWYLTDKGVEEIGKIEEIDSIIDQLEEEISDWEEQKSMLNGRLGHDHEYTKGIRDALDLIGKIGKEMPDETSITPLNQSRSWVGAWARLNDK